MSEVAPTDLPATTPPPVPKPWGVWATLGLSLAIAAAYTVAQAFIMGFVIAFATLFKYHIAINDLGGNGLVLSIATLGALPVLTGLCLLFAWLRKNITVIDYLGFHRFSLSALARWTVVFLVFMILEDWITDRLQKPVVTEFMLQAYRTAGSKPLLWLTLVVGAPLGEELFFRSFLFQGIRYTNLGNPGAILITSALWAAIHLQYDLCGMLMIFATGLILGLVRCRLNSVFPGMILHGLMNALATLQVIAEINGLASVK